MGKSSLVTLVKLRLFVGVKMESRGSKWGSEMYQTGSVFISYCLFFRYFLFYIVLFMILFFYFQLYDFCQPFLEFLFRSFYNWISVGYSMCDTINLIC